MLKCQFHCHVTAPGHFEYIPYTPIELIDQAVKDNFNVISITAHTKVVFDEKTKKYAEEKGILLIPGIEVEIGDGHIIVINATKEAEKIKSFQSLRKYKLTNPKSLIIAAHPYFPFKDSLKLNLEPHIDCFDAIEHSYAYTKWLNFNNKAELIANKHNLPFIATADSHILSYLNVGYTMVDTITPALSIIINTSSNYQKAVDSVISAVKAGKIHNHTAPTTIWKILKFFIIQIILRQILRLKIK